MSTEITAWLPLTFGLYLPGINSTFRQYYVNPRRFITPLESVSNVSQLSSVSTEPSITVTHDS